MVGICEKDATGLVQAQNAACSSACGDQRGKRCADRCMALWRERAATTTHGTLHHPALRMGERDYEVFMVAGDAGLTTFLVDLTARRREHEERLQRFPLSARERQIAGLILQRRTNAEIARQLFISPQTVKTHINNILKKVPRALLPR